MEVSISDIKESKQLAKPSLEEEFHVKLDNSTILSRLQVASLGGMIVGLYELGYGTMNP